MVGFPSLVIVVDLPANLNQSLSGGLSKGTVALACVYGMSVMSCLVLGGAAPGWWTMKAELLGLKQVGARDYRPNFVYRADDGWIYVVGGLEVRPRAMREVVLEREGSGADYPTIVIAAQQGRYADSTRRWTLAHGQMRYL